MPTSLIPAFLLYCAVSAITPGPANLCSFASAMKYGRRQALRQWWGIFAGFAVVAIVISLVVWFLGSAMSRFVRVLTWIGAAYILWFAWHILRSEGGEEAEAGAHCSFFTGLMVQLTNPKIMVFCMTALTTYALPYAQRYWDVCKIALLLPFTGPMANLIWLFAGAALQRFFRAYQKPVNILMALSLVYCAVRILIP